MKKIIKKTPYIIIAILVGVTAVYAGNLIPPGSPSKSMKSLSDLYELINTGTNTPSIDFTTPSTVSSTMYSIGDTYDLLSTNIGAIDGTKILTGTNIFGVDGIATAGIDTSDADATEDDIFSPKTAYVNGVKITGIATAGVDLSNMQNGSDIAGDYPSNVGGVTDSTGAGTFSVGSYSSTWTTCDVSNSYCGTGDSTNAFKKDENTGLVWSNISPSNSNWFTANNCQYPNLLPGDDGACGTNGEVACKCVKLVVGKTGCEALGGNWRLPHQKELLQAYIDGEAQILTTSTFSFWSATTNLLNTSGAYRLQLYDNFANNVVKTTSTFRYYCVQ